MSAKMPVAVRDGFGEEPVVFDLPAPSSKFGFAWPGSSPPPAYPDQHLSRNASDLETDPSEAISLAFNTTVQEESGSTTPFDNIDSDSTSMESLLPSAPPPSFSRASTSSPTASQLQHLRNPRRTTPFSEGDWNTEPLELSPEVAQFHDFSLELADSVQVAIQTLLHLSPFQLLDPAKEHLSGYAVSVPTPSMSAILTCMKNLNFLAANMPSFSVDSSLLSGSALPDHPSTSPAGPVLSETLFDIGEMLQSIGDSLSGLAAQAGVDLVLFHQDVGMKHVAVKGDENALAYTLSYVVRQVIGTAWRGDTIEIGLFTTSFSDSTDIPFDSQESSSSQSPASRLKCTFYIGHRVPSSIPSSVPSSVPSLTNISRSVPSFQTITLRRLVSRINAEFLANVPSHFTPGRASELTITLDLASLHERPSLMNSFLGVEIAREPTLHDLAQFSENLRGKKVTLCASSRGAFAHYLSSYLTAWGLDVSHFSIDPQNLSSGDAVAPEGEGYQFPPPAIAVLDQSQVTPSFVLIDDNVDVLNDLLERLRLHAASKRSVHCPRRPTLNNRQKSTSQVPRGTGVLSPSLMSTNTVIIHFTGLANYKRVKEVIQQVFSDGSSLSLWRLAVIVIPKPAGPRRILTALCTAVKNPVVDPFFTPIATTPMTPTTQPPLQFDPFDNILPRHIPRPSGGQRTNSDRSIKSPRDVMMDPAPLPSSPLAISDNMEYFSDAALKLGSSPSSGLVVQSPSGQPAGIFFLPGAKTTGLGLGIGHSSGVKASLSSPTMERDRGQFGVSPRRSSESMRNHVTHFSVADSSRRSPRPPMPVNLSEHSGTPESSDPPAGANSQADPLRVVPGKQSQSFEGTSQRMSSPPLSPGSAIGGTRRGNAVRRTGSDSKPATSPTSPNKKTKNVQDATIVPPISVLIVDDNPINQTILSTFMKKKKIKYDVAKNGEEAVQKWKSGVFHLILMDIQMPVMDGIQATKEIRRMEKLNGAVGFPSAPLATPPSEGPTSPYDADSRLTSTPYRSSVIIVALTASSLQSDRVAALAAGCNDFLTKPVSLHWLNSKIIEWGSIKALQMWADIRPEVVKNFSRGQAAQAQNVARRLHVPEGRTTPTRSRSRSSSLTKLSKFVSSPKPSSLGEISRLSPDHETSSPLPVNPLVTTATNTTVDINADIVSFDEEFMPGGDDMPNVDEKGEIVDKTDSGRPIPATEGRIH